MSAGRWFAGGVGAAPPGPTADGRMPPGLFGRMLWLSLLLHGALLAGLLVGVRLHLPSPTAPEARVTVKFDKGVRPTRPALERGRHPGPVSRPLARMAGRVRQPQIRGPAVGPGVRGTGGGGGRGGVEGLGEGLGSGDGFGLGGGVGGPVGKGEFPAGTGSGPLSAAGIGPGGGGGGGSALAGVRAGAEEVDLGVELLDVEAMDTGRHQAVVVVDPADRRGVKGFLYLSSLYSTALERSEVEAPFARRSYYYYDGKEKPARAAQEARVLEGLADALSVRTGIKALVRDCLPLSDPALLRAPFLLLSVLAPFALPNAEAEALGRYLTTGGFVYAEVVNDPSFGLSSSVPQGPPFPADPCLRALIRTGLAAAGCREGRDWRFSRLPPEHPLYHSFYDLGSLPQGYWSSKGGEQYDVVPPHLEGIELRGRLVGVYSLRDYADCWLDDSSALESDQPMDFRAPLVREGALRLGVNILVYALTREGSLAQQLVAAK